VASTQFSAANTVRVVLEAVDQSDLDTIAVPTNPDVHYRRLDGRLLNLPCCNVIRVSDVVVRDYRSYADVNPVAGGGPVGVGAAAGRSMRFSLVSMQIVVVATALAVYGVHPNFVPTV
jgi:hypothetical protein